jgi:hypothetical protein
MDNHANDVTRRLEEVERRLAEAEETIALLLSYISAAEGLGTTVRAPLRVVDAEGKLLFEVCGHRGNPSYNEMRIYSLAGEKVATLGSQAGGGFLAVRNDEGKLIGYLDCENYGARMEILNNQGEGGVMLFGQEEGGGINIMSVDSTVGLWTTKEGSEIEILLNNPERKIVSLAVSSSDGQVQVRRESPAAASG